MKPGFPSQAKRGAKRGMCPAAKVPAPIAGVVFVLLCMLSADISFAEGIVPPPGARPFSGIEEIKSRGTLVVAQSTGESPPFFFYEEKKTPSVPDSMRFALPDGKTMAGIDIELAKSIALALGVALDLRRDYAGDRAVINAVSAGEADLGISNLVLTSAGLQKVRFTESYATFPFSLAVERTRLRAMDPKLAEMPLPEDIDRFFNRPASRIAVGRGTPAEDQFPLLFPDAVSISYGDDARLAELLSGRDVIAVLDTEFSFRWRAMVDPEMNLFFELLNLPDSPARVAVAVNPRMPELGAIADEVVRYSRAENARQFFAENGNLMQALAENHNRRAGAPDFRWNAPAAARRAEEEGNRAFHPASLLTVGLPLAAFSILWFRMSKNGGRRLIL